MRKNRFKCLIILAVLSLFAVLSGCSREVFPPSSPRPQISEREKAPDPGRAVDPTLKTYTVLGQTYTPLACAEGFVEEGIASWYGPKFHGRQTASGEIFNMYEMTAAHRLLPMHTLVLVTNLDNGKSVKLRINDRGPFVDDRVIDLSLAAARKLEMIGPGTAPVRVEAVGSACRYELPGTFYVQVGSFASRDNAMKTQNIMRRQGYRETRLQKTMLNGQAFWRVQAGKFNSLGSAEKAKQSLEQDYSGTFIVAD